MHKVRRGPLSKSQKKAVRLGGSQAGVLIISLLFAGEFDRALHGSLTRAVLCAAPGGMQTLSRGWVSPSAIIGVWVIMQTFPLEVLPWFAQPRQYSFNGPT